MRDFLIRWLGINMLEKAVEDLSIDDTKIVDKVRKAQKDVNDLIVYLNVLRVEEWGEDKRFNPPQTVVISSKFVKNAKNSQKSSKRTHKGKARSVIH